MINVEPLQHNLFYLPAEQRPGKTQTWQRCDPSCQRSPADLPKLGLLGSGRSFQAVELWTLPWQPSSGLALPSSRAELGVGLGKAAGAQVPWPEQLPPPSDKERFVVLPVQHGRRSPISLPPLSPSPLFFLLGL